MKLLYLGTAAAEAIPGVFCDCEACRHARKAGGKEIRTRSGALVDGVLKLDFGPDSYMQMLRSGLEFWKLRALLITHSHADHFRPDELGYHRAPYGYFPEGTCLTVYGNGKVGEMMQPILNDSLAFRRMIPFEPVEIEGYTVTALEAVHTLQPDGDRWPIIHNSTTYYRSEEALFYLIEKDGASILYAHDTDEFSPADMEFLSGKKIGLISLDCTNGSLNPDYIGHMGAEDNLRMREKLLACGAADEHTVFVANHFSHNGVCSYEQLQALMPGFVISHDSMEIRVPAR